MTQIRAFRAIHYNSKKIDDISKVVCPPYDVISKEQQAAFYNSHPHNFIRILLGKDKSSDSQTSNKYTRAKDFFDKWLKEENFVQDQSPCIYFYRQDYKIMGEKHSRLGFISLMKIEDDKDAKIFPHEKTHTKAKEDRLKLNSIINGQLSSIFVCFSDKERVIEKIFNKLIVKQKPIIDIQDEDQVGHVIYRLDDPALITEIESTMHGKFLFIADGHHRYEVAKELRKQKASKYAKTTNQESFNYILTYFTNMDSKDLKILPMHRIVRKIPQDLEFLKNFFRIDKVKDKEELVLLLAKAGKNESAFGIYQKQGCLLLRLINRRVIDQVVTEGSASFKRLDATILKYFVFDKVGVKSEDIIYTKDLQEGTRMVDEGQADAFFIMNPVQIQQLREIALNAERMPPKTTYFYPKVLSGLTIHKFDE